MPMDTWLCEKAMKLNTQDVTKGEVEENEEGDVEVEYLLDPKDYEIYINPKVLGETVE